MPFLTNSPDLTQTIFTETDLQIAREYLSSVIARVNTSWLEKAKGSLGKHWNSDSVYSTCFLIDIARAVFFFEQGITQRSAPLFPSKVNGILVPPSEREFIENLTEFQVASTLIQHVRPLDIDPMVPDKDLLSSPNGRRPTTPDFAFQLPDCKVYMDATVLHIAALDTWDKCIDDLTSILKKHLRKQQRNFSVNITLPFPFLGNISDLAEVLKKKIDKQLSGDMNIGSGGKIEWQSIPLMDTNDSSSKFSQFFSMSSPVAIFAPSEGSVRNAFAQWSSFATMPDEGAYKANELLFKSLRNTLNGKQDQMPHNQPSLLAIRLGHPRLLADRLIEKIQERIWPNPDYDWLTGIFLFTPRNTFAKGDPEHSLIPCANPEACCPATASLLSLFG